MNRLAPHNAAPRTGKVQHLLDHLDDARPEEAETLREWLSDPDWPDQTIAKTVTKHICREDRLGYEIGATAVRNYRDSLAVG